jgi:hypothetical protein
MEEPLLKCEHGIYIPKGDVLAHYCTACSPGSSRIIVAWRPVVEKVKLEHVIDTVAYFDRPLGERLELANLSEIAA